METQYALQVGLDWADRKHDLAILEDGARSLRQIASTPEAIDAWLGEARRRHPGGRFAVCLEQNRGTVFAILSKYDFVELYPINPATLANYRKAFVPSGAKDDPNDARMLLELLERHRESLRRVSADTTEMRALRAFCETRRKCVDARTRHCNALQSLLKTVFPQALELCGARLYGALALDLLERWGSLRAFQGAPRKTVAEFFRRHHAAQTRTVRAEEIRRGALPVTEDRAILEPAEPMLRQLLAQIRATNAAVQDCEERIEAAGKRIAELRVFASFPRAGKALAPRLAAAFGSDRSRWQSVRDFQAYAGVAPVTETSGKSRWVHWRWSCPKFLRQTLVEYAKESTKGSAWARAYYDQLRERGKTHNQALRALAWKWTRILWRCWQDDEEYDEARYLAALRKQGSWIAEKCQG